ncbi:hypothetical protein D3877_27360 [Azospirillum cavernae]|uniref:Uncharacterized protein n=1 Tax=Azospirillum cavernae TaxID=2320860 RepID=A0A418VMS7_9PROT|nr:hypothetical protein D3877_27360 [Azospirillum cavernae]
MPACILLTYAQYPLFVNGFVAMADAISRPLFHTDLSMRDVLIGDSDSEEKKKEEIYEHLYDCMEIIDNSSYGKIFMENGKKKLKTKKPDEDVIEWAKGKKLYGYGSFGRSNADDSIQRLSVFSQRINEFFIGLQFSILVSCVMFFCFFVFPLKEGTAHRKLEIDAVALHGRRIPSDEHSPPKSYAWSLITMGESLYWNTSGFLVSLGFMGTFAGLLVAMWAFPSQEIFDALAGQTIGNGEVMRRCWATEMKLQLAPQASALRTAFATSVVGLALAVLVRVMHAIHDHYVVEDHAAIKRRDKAIEDAAQAFAQGNGGGHGAGTAAPENGRATPAIKDKSVALIDETVVTPGQVGLNAELLDAIKSWSGASETWKDVGAHMHDWRKYSQDMIEGLRILNHQIRDTHRDTRATMQEFHLAASEVRDAVAVFRSSIEQVEGSVRGLTSNMDVLVTQAQHIAREVTKSVEKIKSMP